MVVVVLWRGEFENGNKRGRRRGIRNESVGDEVIDIVPVVIGCHGVVMLSCDDVKEVQVIVDSMGNHRYYFKCGIQNPK